MFDRRWTSLAVLCAGLFMIILDSTIVNVALPAIRDDLGFAEADLAWVVNAYVIAFGGLLLLAGRLADLIGRRTVFLGGLGAFVGASLLCALAPTPEWLIAARFAQGAGGALVSAPILGMVVALFPQPGEQAKAIGAYAFVGSGGATLGLVLGGVLTDALSWHWIFLVNVPIGLATIAFALRLVAAERGLGLRAGADVGGAVLVVAALMVGVLAIIELSWPLGLLALAGLGAFVLREDRARTPLVPLRIFASRPLAVANVVQAMGIVGMAGQQFLVALFLQREHGYDALQIGLATVPTALVIAVASLGFAARLIGRFGPQPVLVAALALMGAGLALLVRLPDELTYAVDLLPAFVLMGAGAGLAMPAWTTLAMSGAAPADAGLASGLFNTTQQLGIAVGVAILATVAAQASYEAAFAVASGFELAAIAVVLVTLPLALPGRSRVPA